MGVADGLVSEQHPESNLDRNPIKLSSDRVYDPLLSTDLTLYAIQRSLLWPGL